MLHHRLGAATAGARQQLPPSHRRLSHRRQPPPGVGSSDPGRRRRYAAVRQQGPRTCELRWPVHLPRAKTRWPRERLGPRRRAHRR